MEFPILEPMQRRKLRLPWHDSRLALTFLYDPSLTASEKCTEDQPLSSVQGT